MMNRVAFLSLSLCMLFVTLLPTPHAEHNGEGGIPLLIFRTFEAENWHAAFHQVLNDTHALSPGYLQVYFSSRDRDRFIARYFPRYLPLYRKLLPGAYRADLWRLLVLFRYGGVYADMGMRMMQPIERVVSRKSPSDDFVCVRDGDDTAILNGFLATKPRLPVMNFLLRWVMDNVEKERYGCNNLDISGPKALGRALHRFLALPPTQAFPVGNITFSAPSLSHPLHVRFHYFIWNEVRDPTHTELVQNKFPNYNAIVYNNGRSNIPYSSLYPVRKIYASSLPASLTPALGDYVSPSPDVYANNPLPHLSRHERGALLSVSDSLSVYEGSLLQRGGEFFLVINGTRWGFPDLATFNSLGLPACKNNAVKFQQPFELLEGPKFSQDPQKHHEEMSRCMPQIKFHDDVEMSFPLSEDELKKRTRQLLRDNRNKLVINADEFLQVMEAH